MRLLFLGDVVGRVARNRVLQRLPEMRQEWRLDGVVINVENAAGGFGVTAEIADAFFAGGADVLTTGNHVWDKREIIGYIEGEPRLLRPHNMAEGTPGSGLVTVELANGGRLAVANLITNLFMAENMPVFPVLEEVLAKAMLGKTADALILDIHGEATSEKLALGLVADGRASLVVGTHTHIPTADTRILPAGTAYQTDAGMCGDYQSVIGMQAEAAIARFTGASAPRLSVALGEPTLNGVLVETDDSSGLAISVEAIREGGVLGG